VESICRAFVDSGKQVAAPRYDGLKTIDQGERLLRVRPEQL